MPRKNFLNPTRLTSAGDMSGDVTSSAVDVRYLDSAALQAVWSNGSTPVGVLTVQGSVNYGQPGVTAAWTTISLSATLNVSGSSGSAIADLTQITYPYVRMVYTRSSGSGSLDIWVSGKEI